MKTKDEGWMKRVGNQPYDLGDEEQMKFLGPASKGLKPDLKQQKINNYFSKNKNISESS